ncbi:MAG TPA: RnfABCDGE type electron transport complex subunit D [Thermoanaerobaculia bacterium]
MSPRLRDPRLFQIATLSALLAWGLVALDLEVRPAIAATILAVALGTQLAAGRLAGLPRFDPRRALISALSLTLLLRTASPAIAALAALLTIGSKFLIRVPGPGGGPPKHVFNPTNLGIAATLLLTDSAWVSPGQWGSAALAAFAVASAGMLVVRRAERSDVTWAFLAAYGAVVLGRALWLGDPLAIPLHQVSNGAFLIFAFFMISDPKTTPDSRAGRILFAVLVALGAGFVHFVLFRPNGLIWSLAALSPLVPLIDRVLPGRRYRWPGGEAAAAAPPAAAAPSPAPSPAAPALAFASTPTAASERSSR